MFVGCLRSFYFLLTLTWIFLLVSVRAGNELSRSYLAALFTKGAAQYKAFNQINADFQAQLDYLFNTRQCSMNKLD
ncbi:hypothetical protein [Pseudomonas sp. 22 E 5]|nr:hypothetical protein [Pseudomonas sp. 22 E 5]